MKILYITQNFQHPHVPGSHRHYHIIKELSRRHDITLFTMVQHNVPAFALKEMRTLTQHIFMYHVAKREKESARSRFIKEWHLRNTIKKMKAAFKKLTAEESFDVILFQGKRLCGLIAKCSIPVVIDFCDANSRRLLHQMRHERLKKFPTRFTRYLMAKSNEKHLLKKSDQVAFISTRDRNAIVGSNTRYRVVPNGVDLIFWNPKGQPPQKHTIAFTGVMSYQPNENAAMYLIQKIMPHLRKAVPDPHLLVIGSSPSLSLQKAGEEFADVTVTGFVDDVRPYLERASIFIAPIHFASGMQNKVLEAMAMTLPVITTPIVAEGLEISGKGDLPVLIAIDEIDFVKHIIRLFNNAEERKKIAAAGRRFVEQHFVWTESASKFEEMCFEAVRSGGRPGVF